MRAICVAFVAASPAKATRKCSPEKRKMALPIHLSAAGREPGTPAKETAGGHLVALARQCAAGTSRAQRAQACCGSFSRPCATSAIIFLTMASPNELKSLATMTNAFGPPTTLLR
jgi:hypothetical protein